MRTKLWVGLKPGKRTVFRFHSTPTQKSHGEVYNAVIGPFRTVRGAYFMANYGAGNPHCQTVAGAERLAKQLKEMFD